MSKKYDYSKSDIANIVEEFKALLAEHECVDDVCIYYNNKRTRYIRNLWDKKEKKFVPLNTWVDDVEGVHPQKYCEYAPSTNIISFSSEGTLCDYMYSGAPEWLEKFALKYGMYIECATSWFFYFAPCNVWSDYETDDTEEHKNYPIILFSPEDYDDNKIPAIKAIALLIKLCDTITLWITNAIAKNSCFIILFCINYGLMQHLVKSCAIEDIVTQYEASSLIANKLFSNNKGLG